MDRLPNEEFELTGTLETPVSITNPACDDDASR
jgi:hypothetical protein